MSRCRCPEGCRCHGTPVLRADATDDDLQVDEEFSQQVTEFMDANDGLLRRLDDNAVADDTLGP